LPIPAPQRLELTRPGNIEREDCGVFEQPAQHEIGSDDLAIDGLFPCDEAGAVDVERLHWSESRLTVGGKL
jgi:hypothetical protein